MFGKRQKENNLKEIRPKGKKKKGRKKKVIAGVVIVAVLGTAGTVVYSKTQKRTDSQSETREAKSAEVTLGDISNTIIGTGNLELDEAEALYIPSGLTVEEVKVESGDHVSAGTVLAVVSVSSVLDAVDDVQEELKELDEKISTCQEVDDENCIESSVSGRVKAIYVAEDSDVTDVMLENGALMELSLDGLMAVDLADVTQVEKGDTVGVTLSDGTELSGTVAELSEDGNCTVTLTDNGTSVDDAVTVSDTDGNILGSGKLYIHEPLEITGTSGTVSSVSVSLNEAVDAGDELLVLEGTSSDAEYEKLLATREARTETLNKLLQLVKNPEITAEQNGTIQDVNISADSTGASTADSTSGSESSAGSSSGSSGNGYSQMSYSTVSSANMINTGMTSTNTAYTNLTCSRVVSDSLPTYQQVSFESADSEAEAVVIDGEDSSSDENKNSTSDTKTDDSNATDVDNKDTSDGTSDSTAEADQTAKNTTESAADNGSGSDSSSNSSDVGNAELNFSDGSQNTSSGNNTSSTESAGNTNTSADNSSTNGSSQNNMQSQNANTGSAASGTASTEQNSDTTENTDKETETDTSQYSTDIEAFSISGDENMCLSVSVDELDINSVEKGQTATVTFDAIEDKEFEGEVTKIGSTASVSGGVAKYTVEITIPKDDEMKQGMNASATITTEERKQVLTLPMNALQEKGDKTFVYTEQESDGTLSGEVEIETGLTDGSTVEITDGLKEGNTVYYMRSEGGSSDNSSNAGMPDMGGDMPSGGEMPDMSGFGGKSDGNSGGGPGGNSGGAPGGGQGGPGM